MRDDEPRPVWMSVCFITVVRVCVYYCRTYYKAVRGGGGGECGTREEPGTLTQGAPVFPSSSRLGIEPKTLSGWLVCVFFWTLDFGDVNSW